MKLGSVRNVPSFPFLAAQLLAPPPNIAVLPGIDEGGAEAKDLASAATTTVKALGVLALVPAERVAAAVAPRPPSSGIYVSGGLAAETSLDCLSALGGRWAAQLLLTGHVRVDERETSITVGLFDVAYGKLIGQQPVGGTDQVSPSDPVAATGGGSPAAAARRPAPRGAVLLHLSTGWTREVDGALVPVGTTESHARRRHPLPAAEPVRRQRHAGPPLFRRARG